MAGLLTLSPNANVFPKKLSDFVTCTVKKDDSQLPDSWGFSPHSLLINIRQTMIYCCKSRHKLCNNKIKGKINFGHYLSNFGQNFKNNGQNSVSISYLCRTEH